MSELLRIGLAAEGFTDQVLISAALSSILGDRTFILTPLQPEASAAFSLPGDAGPFGGGWKGVHKWCRQTARRAAGHFSGDILFESYDLLVIHLDADVAFYQPTSNPSDLEYLDLAQLPCARPCPPARDTVDALRQVAATWMGETTLPARAVFCMPSKSTEAWVMAALFPDDAAMILHGECHADPASRLPQQQKAVRIRKSEKDYRSKSQKFRERWPIIAQTHSEANRFQTELLAAI